MRCASASSCAALHVQHASNSLKQPQLLRSASSAHPAHRLELACYARAGFETVCVPRVAPSLAALVSIAVAPGCRNAQTFSACSGCKRCSADRLNPPRHHVHAPGQTRFDLPGFIRRAASMQCIPERLLRRKPVVSSVAQTP